MPYHTNQCDIETRFKNDGKALRIAEDLGAVSKPALEHFIVGYLAVNFQEINRSEGSRGFIAGRIELHLYVQCKVPLFRGAGPPLSILVPTGGGDSEYLSLAYLISVHSAELDDIMMKSFLPLTDWPGVVLSAFASLELVGAPNARNYQCNSTMHILPEMTISCSVQGHCAQYRQIIFNLDMTAFG
jgi:hypothetical protein